MLTIQSALIHTFIHIQLLNHHFVHRYIETQKKGKKGLQGLVELLAFEQMCLEVPFESIGHRDLADRKG